MKHSPILVASLKKWFSPLVAFAVLASVSVVAASTGSGTISGMAVDSSSTATPTSVEASPSPTASMSTPNPTAGTAAAQSGAVSQDASTTAPAVTSGGGGAKNIVHAVNQVDNRLSVDGHVQVNSIPGPTVNPKNEAFAYGSCTSCQTLAVALQIDLISTTATDVRPENIAVAINYQCNDCLTVALALQYVFSVQDPTQVSPEIRQLEVEMKQELASLHGDPGLTLADAEARINAVIAQFQDLATSLNTKREEASAPTSPNATPISTSTATPSPIPTPTSTAEPTPSDTPVTDTPQASPTETATDTPQPTASPTP